MLVEHYKLYKDFCLCFFQAVKHLHDHNVVHMDIKPENIFISNDDVCKLGDFGLMLDMSSVSYMVDLLWCVMILVKFGALRNISALVVSVKLMIIEATMSYILFPNTLVNSLNLNMNKKLKLLHFYCIFFHERFFPNCMKCRLFPYSKSSGPIPKTDMTALLVTGC